MIHAAAAAKLLHSCLTLCDPRDGSPPGSPIPGILQQVRSLGWEDPLKEGVAIHSSILVWRISQTEEPGGLQSIGSQSQT